MFKKITTSFIISLGFSATLLFFAPLQIFTTNPTEFSLLFSQLLQCVALIGVIVVLSMGIILSVLPLKYSIHSKAASLMVGLTILLWLQGTLLVWNYGPLDGRDIHWGDYLWQGILDSSIWIIVLVVAFIKSPVIYKEAKKISLGLIGLQLVSFLFFYFQMSAPPSFKDYTLDETNKFRFSKDKNVIILVLDSFQPDAFQEIINRDTSFKNMFSGFTFFRNTLAGHPFTETSTMNILTGQYFENKMQFDDRVKNSFLTNSIPKALSENGFEVDIYPIVKRSIYHDPQIISNLIRRKAPASVIRNDISFLYDLSLFRYFPHYLKQYVFNSQEWLFKKHPELFSDVLIDSQDDSHAAHNQELDQTSKNSELTLKYQNILHFVHSIDTEFSNNGSKPTFKYYHIDIPHWPLIVNEKFEYEKMEVNRANYLRQSIASLKLANLFLKKLKESNIYDNSLIFIIADHGAGAQNQSFIPQNGFPSIGKGTVLVNWQKINAIPLALAKPFNSNGELKCSDAPISHIDIRKTIFSQLSIPIEVPGYSVFDPGIPFNRERIYIYNTSYDPIKNSSEIPLKWYVRGYSWLAESWHLISEASHAQSASTYNYRDTLHFIKTGNGVRYLISGWSFPENLYTWSDGKKSVLKIEIEKPETDLLLRASVIPYLLEKKITTQEVGVFINGNKISDWSVSSVGVYHSIIPRRYINDDTLSIAFLIPNATKPYTSSGEYELRNLGIALKSLVINEASFYRYGTPVLFKKTGNFSKYSGAGWTIPEKNSTWTSGVKSEMLFRIDHPDDSLILSADIVPLVFGKKLSAQHVVIHANDSLVGSWVVSQPGNYSISIPRFAISEDYLKLTFELPDAISPQKLGMNNDPRELALMFKTISLIEAPALPKSVPPSAEYAIIFNSEKNHRFLVGPEKKGIQILPDSIDGAVDIASITHDTLHIAGWAANTRHSKTSKTVVVFINGKFARAVTANFARPDVAAEYKNPSLAQCGFTTDIPVGSFGHLDNSAVVSVFAVSPLRLIASELHYPAEYPFKH